MPKPSAISLFIAATSLLVASAGVPALQAQDAGGLKEWNTDQGLDEESVLDADAAALKEKAEQEARGHSPKTVPCNKPPADSF